MIERGSEEPTVRTYNFKGAFQFKVPGNLISQETVADGKGGLILSVGFDDNTKFSITMSPNGSTITCTRDFSAEVADGKTTFR